MALGQAKGQGIRWQDTSNARLATSRPHEFQGRIRLASEAIYEILGQEADERRTKSREVLNKQDEELF